jgi:hypothetical protein
MVRETVLPPIVILQNALTRLIQNSISVTGHTHLLPSVVNVTIIIVLVSGLKQ